MKMTVDLKEHSYPIYIERGILKEAAERIAEVYQGSKIMIISDDRVYSYYGEALKKNLSEKYECTETVIPHGEPSKAFETLPGVYSSLLEAKISRTDLIVALGGGVVGDLAGFVADQHRHISAGNLGVRNSFFRSKSQLNGSPAGRLIIPYSINIIQAPQHHRAGRRRSNRVIGAVASIAIPCNQIICDAVAHIAFCPFRNIRKAAKAAVKGAVRFKLLGICDNSGEQRRHLRPCQPLLQHHVARLVAQHHAGFTQIGGSRLLRTFFGGKRSYC